MIAAVMFLLGVLAGPANAGEVSQDAKDILGDDTYAFCHDESYPLTAQEAGWCPLVGDSNERCPALPGACDAPRAELMGMPGRLTTRTARESSDGDTTPPPRQNAPGPKRRQASEPEQIEIPAFGGIGQVLFWVVLAVAVAFVVYMIGSAALGGRGESDKPVDDEQGPAGPRTDYGSEADRIVETDVERLLRLAQSSAGKGEFDDAVSFAHAALLRRLDHDGKIRLHKSRTNGDYVRDLSAEPELRGKVRDVLREVDRVHFGNQPAARPVFETIFSRVSLLVRSGALALVFAVLGLACIDGSGAKEYPWNTSPSGSKALLELMDENGIPASYRAGSLETLAETKRNDDDDDDEFDPDDYDPEFGFRKPKELIVLLRDVDLTDEEWEGMLQWVGDGGNLVVATGLPLPSDPLKFNVGIQPSFVPGLPAEGAVTEEFLFDLGSPTVRVPDSNALGVDRIAVHEVMRRGEHPYVVVVDHGKGQVVVFGDDHLFTNAALAVPDNAAFIVAMMTTLTDRIELVDAWTGAGAEDPMEVMARSDLTPVVLQLLAFIAVLLLWRGAKFGRLRDPPSQSRRAFSDHVRALGLQYARARAAGHATGLYTRWALDRLRDRMLRSSQRSMLGLAQSIAARTGHDETEVMKILLEAESSESGNARPSLKAMRRLARLLRETRGTR